MVISATHRLCCAVVHETVDVPGVLHLFLLPDDIKLPIDNNGAQAASSESMVT
jgi:hypothetical protein